MEYLLGLFEQARTTQTAPQWLGLAVVPAAALFILLPPLWPLARNVVTIAHEGGHAATAWLTGRKLSGIRLHSDTSGVTVSAGKPTGLGMILTAFAGYTAPSLWGLAMAYTLHTRHITALLCGTLLLLAIMLLLIRNLYGALTVIVSALALWVLLRYTPDLAQSAAAYLLTWFLLLSAPRPVWELHRLRRAGEAEDSDADQLARLTGIPGIVWIGVFFAVTIASALWAVKLLLF